MVRHLRYRIFVLWSVGLSKETIDLLDLRHNHFFFLFLLDFFLYCPLPIPQYMLQKGQMRYLLFLEIICAN